jgi:cytochrome c oxidase assembly protein subunit 16
MAVFPSKKFRSSAEAKTVASRYRSSLARHPFLLFGLPFIATMVAGSFFLTPATAIRYEKHDRRVRRLSKEEELGIGKAGRRVDMKEVEDPITMWLTLLNCWSRPQRQMRRTPGEHTAVITGSLL